MDTGYEVIQLLFPAEDVGIARHCSVPDARGRVNEGLTAV